MDVKAVLVCNDRLYHVIVPTGGQVSFGSGKKDTVNVEGFDPKQIVITNRNSGVSLKGMGIDQKKIPMESIIILDERDQSYVYITSLVRKSVKQYRMPYRGTVKLGRNIYSNDIAVNLPFISNEHLVFRCDSGAVRVEDLDSSNGTYINGKRITAGKLKPGDDLSILSLTITLNNGFLTFEGVNEDLTLREVESSGTSSVKDDSNPDKLVFHKSPRVQESLPSQEVIIANPPTKGQKYEKGRGAGSMLLGSGAMIGASMLTGMMSPALMAARSASLISPISSAVNTGKVNKKRRKSLADYTRDRKEKYGAYIEDQKALIESVASVQRNIITVENPAPDEAIRTVLDLKRSLWERMPGNRDYLDVRIGMGYENLCVPVKSKSNAAGFKMEDDEAEELVEQIVEETRIVDNIPTRISLLKNNTIGFIGNRQDYLKIIRNMIICLCSSHSYEDIKLIGIFDENEKEYWSSLRWIPHFWDNEKENCMIAYDEDGANAMCDYISDVIASREDNLKNSGLRDAEIPSPFYIIIFGSKRMVEDNLVMNNLFANDPCLGITSLFLYDDIYELPPKCRYILDMSDIPSFYNREVANEKTFFTADKGVNNAEFDHYARVMSGIIYEGFASRSGLPKSISFLEGYGVQTVEELNVASRWASAVPDKSLAAPIGKLAGDETLFFDIHEKAHGPHGLVAGTTGSGKSELLQTWILSMACNFHPHQVSFVLIDYKGGGMANLLEPLPHVVGKITNIGSNIQRSLISLQSEIVRRQIIFDKYQKVYPNIKLNHIDSYQKLFREGKVSEPLPHLIIVADEFAELKKEEPDFMAGLVKAARVGRSLGIHLVLATQKPGGIVDDQISSNSRFRLCLKVQDSVDSREMIERGDAAFIREAGRGFIRVGKDEYFDKFQSYWSGAPYFGDQPKNIDENPVRLVDECGHIINLFKSNKKRVSEVDELTAVVNHINDVSARLGVVPAPGPWLPELPEKLSLDDLNVTNPNWLKIPVGMYDIPARQEQGIQLIDFIEQGHHAIYGAPGTGKTTFLKTLVSSICKYYTPEEIAVYIIDCGGWGMSVFADMPHVGGVVLDFEEEKLLKLEQMIREEFNRRKMIFLRNNVTSLSAYRESVDSTLPAIIIVIDNIVPIFDLYPDIENFLIKVANEGTSYGIYLVYSANSTSGVRYKIIQNMKGAVALELTDKGDFVNIVGRLNGMTLPPVQGRAFAKGNPPIEFQIALYAPGENDKTRNVNLKILVEKTNSEWTGKRTAAIPVMPDIISTNMMREHYSKRTVLPVGLLRSDIKPAYIDLTEKYGLVITGESSGQMSRFTVNLADLILSMNKDALLYTFDSEKHGLSCLEEYSACYSIHNDNDSVTDSLSEIIKHLNERKDAQKAASKAEGSSFSEEEFIKQYPLILVLVDDIKKYVDDVSNENVNSMERICRLAQHLGVIVIVNGTINDIAKNNEIDTLTRSLVSYQNGLAIAGTPNQITFFRNNLKFNEKDSALEPGSGYLFNAGECKTFKYIEKGDL